MDSGCSGQTSPGASGKGHNTATHGVVSGVLFPPLLCSVNRAFLLIGMSLDKCLEVTILALPNLSNM